MNSKEKTLKSFYSTMSAPCPYVDGRFESKLATDISGPYAQEWANTLSRAGFRRSHAVCYIPTCPNCSACVSVRIPVSDFILSKKNRKNLRVNSTMEINFLPNVATAEQYDLFASYLMKRHANSEMNQMYYEEYRAMIEDASVDSGILEVRQNNKLQAAMLIDIFDDGLSAVYSFFNPRLATQSLGTYMILKLIERALNKGLPYVYLGYFIPAVSNMAYKAKFQPLEYFVNGKWERSIPNQV